MRWTMAQFIVLQLLLIGCAGQPSFVGSDRELGAEHISGSSTEIIEANPYLQGRHSVPAQAQRRFAEAQLLIEEEEWQRALLKLQGLEKSYPRLSGPCINLALVYRQLGDVEQAEYWFQKSIANNVSNTGAYDQYGIFLREQGRFDDAEIIYLQALEQWEASADTHRNIGILYDLYAGEPEKALRHYYRYKALTGGKDREVAGWIVDLERRYKSAEEGPRS